MRRTAALVLFLGSTLLAGVAVAEDADIHAIVERAVRIKREAATMPAPAWLYGARPTELPMSNPDTGNAEALRAPFDDGRRVVILASWALGEAALKDLFLSVAGRNDVQVAFRGVLPGETFGQGIRRLHAILREIDPLPNVIIDPTLFTRLGATTAPVVAYTDGADVLAHATGILSPEFILDRVKDGARGDQGTLGPTVEISEPDIIEVMQAKARDFDIEGYKRRAQEEFWSKARFEDLPQATERRVRSIDPTVVVTKSITDAEGRILVPAGNRVNPLDMLPFTQRLVIFDAASPGQVEVAAKLAAEVRGMRRVTLMITGMDRNDGWKGLDRIEARVDGPVYLLTHDVKARFKLERVPAMVESNGQVFVVTEVPAEKDIH